MVALNVALAVTAVLFACGRDDDDGISPLTPADLPDRNNSSVDPKREGGGGARDGESADGRETELVEAPAPTSCEEMAKLTPRTALSIDSIASPSPIAPIDMFAFDVPRARSRPGVG